MDRDLDIAQTAAIILVMLLLVYGLYLLRIALRGATQTLHSIVRSQDEIRERLDALEARR